MSKIVITGINNKVCCVDPMANNYDPTATEGCLDGCCTYDNIIGCRDTLANNYNSSANIDCNNCCTYVTITRQSPTNAEIIKSFNLFELKTSIKKSLASNVIEIIPESNCPIDLTCVDYNTISWWDNVFTSSHNGQSLQTTNNLLWKKLIILTTSGESKFWVNTINGELLSENCCVTNGGTYNSDGICVCTDTSQRLIRIDKDEVTSQPIKEGVSLTPFLEGCQTTSIGTRTFKDEYNNTISILYNKKNGKDINEQCCRSLIDRGALPNAIWNSPYCYAKKTSSPNTCLPFLHKFDDKPTQISSCESDVKIKMIIRFNKPRNSCDTIPNPADNDIIYLSGPPTKSDIVISPNTSLISHTSMFNRDYLNDKTSISNPQLTPEPSTDEPCCYKTTRPIKGRIKLTNSNVVLTQVKEYNSSTDYFGTWVELEATIPNSVFTTTPTLSFNLNLEIYDGLNCCCRYDVLIKSIDVSCSRTTSTLRVGQGIQCPGFDIDRVIDNKKSWVYNPGNSYIGVSEYDVIEREDGGYGLLNGEGSVDRTFSPSLDSELPWRYTDYYKQSGVYENHSNLVLNSKEFELTFDMCGDCPISGSSITCPNGFSLSANTSVCYNLTGTTSATTIQTVTYLNLYNLENYKKTFQSFWIPFMEQFIPATTLWTAGERWCNEPCTIIDPCDYDFELVDSEVSVQKTPGARLSSEPRIPPTTTVPITIESIVGNGIQNKPLAEVVVNPLNILTIRDLGLVSETRVVFTKRQADTIPYMENYSKNLLKGRRQIFE